MPVLTSYVIGLVSQRHDKLHSLGMCGHPSLYILKEHDQPFLDSLLLPFRGQHEGFSLAVVH